MTNTSCDRIHETRDYALDEMAGPARHQAERHIAECEECAAEFERLHVTTLTLRAVPDSEIPQRIAFVSDKVFEPSLFARFWNSAPRLGFASACVLAAALMVFAYHKPVEIRMAANPGPTKAEIAQQVDDAVARAVTQIRAEDAKTSEAALKASDLRHEQQYRSLMVAMEENMTVLEKRLNTNMMFAANDAARFGTGQ